MVGAATVMQSQARVALARQTTNERRAFAGAIEAAGEQAAQAIEKQSEEAEWQALDARAAKLSHRDHK